MAENSPGGIKEWVLTISSTDKELLGHVRCVPGLLAADDQNIIWLRGISSSQMTGSAIRSLPSLQTFGLDQKGNLFPPQKQTPVRTLPQLDWQSIETFIPLEIPTSAIPARISEQFQVEIVASEDEKEAQALMTPAIEWLRFAESSPVVRLEQLRFALASNQEVLILGHPLPPIPGRSYWQKGSLLLPGGFDFRYAILAGPIQQKMTPDGKDFILFDISGKWSRIPSDAFIPASRSAVRMSIQSLTQS